VKAPLIYPNERVGLIDINDGLSELPREEHLRQAGIFILPPGRLTALTMTEMRTLGGWDLNAWVVDTSTQLTLNRGTALLKLYCDDGVLRHCILFGDCDPATYIIDVSLLADDLYAVYIRAVQAPGDPANRVFWNQGGSPAEYTDMPNTRNTPTWEATILTDTAPPPGHGEWMKIYKVQVLSGKVHAVTDYRHSFFEGSVPGTYPEEWGGGVHDRNANRILYGVKDLHWFVQLVRRQLAEIIGVKHYTSSPRSLTALAVEHKVSGAHSDVNADTLIVTKSTALTGAAGEDAVVSCRPAPMNPDDLNVWLTNKIDTERNLWSLDREGVLSGPNLMYESFHYPTMADIESLPGIPGERFGKYFTAASTPIVSIGRSLLDTDRAGGRCCVMRNEIGIAATCFGGVRTGAFNNGQATNGFWRLRDKPWLIATFMLTAVAGGHESVHVGFANDKSPLDTDPSRVYVNFDKATDTALLYVVADDGTVATGAVNLLGAGTLDANTLYTVKITILANNQARVMLVNTGLFEVVSLGAKQMLEVDGSDYIGYSSFVTAVNYNGLFDYTRAALYRWVVGDSAYLGMPTAL
jgi:hypothetical protein